MKQQFEHHHPGKHRHFLRDPRHGQWTIWMPSLHRYVLGGCNAMQLEIENKKYLKPPPRTKTIAHESHPRQQLPEPRACHSPGHCEKYAWSGRCSKRLKRALFFRSLRRPKPLDRCAHHQSRFFHLPFLLTEHELTWRSLLSRHETVCSFGFVPGLHLGAVRYAWAKMATVKVQTQGRMYGFHFFMFFT